MITLRIAHHTWKKRNDWDRQSWWKNYSELPTSELSFSGSFGISPLRFWQQSVSRCMNVIVQASYGESHTSHSLPYSFQGNAAPYGDSTVYQEVLPSQVKRSCIIVIQDALWIFFMGNQHIFPLLIGKGCGGEKWQKIVFFFVLQSVVVVTLHFMIVTVFVSLMLITMVVNDQWLLTLCQVIDKGGIDDDDIA